MKRLLLIILPLLLIVGCSKKPIKDSTLYIGGDGSMMEPGSGSFTGQVFELYDNGHKAFDGIYKDGSRHGEWTYYTDVGDGIYSVTYTAGILNVAVFTDNLGTDYVGDGIYSVKHTTDIYRVAVFTDGTDTDYTGSPITGAPKQDGQFFVLRDEYGFSKYPESFRTIKNGKSIGKWTYWYEDGLKIFPIIPDIVTVKGGTFKMGSNRDGDEEPIHSVTVSDFSLSKTEVTFDQYDAFCTLAGIAWAKATDVGWINWRRGDRPVINVSWHDAVAFCEWMSKVTGKTYRLPTEAEWEYAARGGNKSKGYTYSGSNEIGSIAWYKNNSDSKTHPVAQKQPNELGLYDMNGNVTEWCSDWYYYYNGSPRSNESVSSMQTDPQGPNSGSSRVLRGGSWRYHDDLCRVAARHGTDPDRRYDSYGFRLVLSQD
jgi:formylglycine-generating enzyme required for sulfatase activity